MLESRACTATKLAELKDSMKTPGITPFPATIPRFFKSATISASIPGYISGFFVSM